MARCRCTQDCQEELKQGDAILPITLFNQPSSGTLAVLVRHVSNVVAAQDRETEQTSIAEELAAAGERILALEGRVESLESQLGIVPEEQPQTPTPEASDAG